ncbi:MAG: phage tail protein [Bacteroidales bacterium]
MAEYYPPVGFHFSVDFSEISDKSNDTRFQSVSGLDVELETETIREGGENRFEHVLPLRSKYPNLTLKRGMLKDSKVIDWCLDAFNNLIIEPRSIVVKLLHFEKQEQDDEVTWEQKPLVSWNIVNAWPIKWNISDLSAEDSNLVIETIELRYQYFTIEK